MAAREFAGKVQAKREVTIHWTVKQDVRFRFILPFSFGFLKCPHFHLSTLETTIKELEATAKNIRECRLKEGYATQVIVSA